MRSISPFDTSWLPETLGDLLACSDPDSLFAAMLRRVRAVSPMAAAVVCRLVDDGQKLEVSRCWTECTSLFRPGLRFSLDQSLVARAFDAAGPSYFPDYDEIEKLPPFAREVRRDGVAASLVVPLSLGGRARGSVNFGFRGTHPLGPDALDLFVALARAYGALHFWMEDAAALERTRNIERTLGQVGLTLLGAGDLRENLCRAIGNLAVEIGAHRAAVVGPSGGARQAYIWYDPGAAPWATSGDDPLVGDLRALCQEATERREPFTVDRVEDAPASLGKVLDAWGSGSGAWVSLPLGDDGHGLLLLLRSAPGSWDPASRRLLSLASRVVALALERHLAEEKRQRAEEQLRRAHALEAVGQLAGGVAHDFNNILGSILGCAYVLGVDGEAPGRLPQELGQIRDLCKRGGDLTRQLLTVARRVPGHKEVVDPARLARDVVRLLGRTIQKNITIEAKIPEGLPAVYADRSMLTTAVLNLCLNARDAMPDGGTMILELEAREGQVTIEVGDTGSGVPEDIRPRIFDPFFTTKPPGQGTGLGLAMVYSTCREIGGDVEVECPPKGGAIFRLSLPARRAHPEGRGGRPPSGPEPHPLTNKWVLVVEDEDDIARAVLRALEDSGYRALRASTGLEALETARSLAGDLGLVVLDRILPERSGDQVLRILSGLVPQVPVLLVTGRDDLAPAECGREPFMVKPFATDEFLNAVARTLGAWPR